MNRAKRRRQGGKTAKLTDEGTASANSSAVKFFDVFSDTDVRFNTSDDTIEVRRSGTRTAVTDIFEKSRVGNQITIPNTDINNGFNRVLLDSYNDRHDTLVAFYDAKISEIENVNPTEIIAKLLDDQQALEASFQIFSRIRQLTLTNFI